jgi:3-hydroxyisobutyrate dehydrogenase-like beta-hydroxyacid dehydrogenase
MTDAVGFIGLGQIGAPMAAHLVEWPGGLVVCDVDPDVVRPFAEQGATVASSPAAVAEQASVISVMVRDDAQVRDVVGALVPAASPGAVIAIHSTINAATAIDLATAAEARRVYVVDAPVSGGFMGAHEGSLAVMVGGADDALERCRPVFAQWASLVVHLGPVGAGTRAKLARNLITFVAYTAAGEAQRLAEAAGVDLRELAAVVRHSDKVTGGAGSIMLRDTTAPMQLDDDWYAILANTRDLGEKDLRLALELGEALSVDLPFAALALDRFGKSLGL